MERYQEVLQILQRLVMTTFPYIFEKSIYCISMKVFRVFLFDKGTIKRVKEEQIVTNYFKYLYQQVENNRSYMLSRLTSLCTLNVQLLPINAWA